MSILENRPTITNNPCRSRFTSRRCFKLPPIFVGQDSHLDRRLSILENRPTITNNPCGSRFISRRCFKLPPIFVGQDSHLDSRLSILENRPTITNIPCRSRFTSRRCFKLPPIFVGQDSHLDSRLSILENRPTITNIPCGSRFTSRRCFKLPPIFVGQDSHLDRRLSILENRPTITNNPCGSRFTSRRCFKLPPIFVGQDSHLDRRLSILENRPTITNIPCRSRFTSRRCFKLPPIFVGQDSHLDRRLSILENRPTITNIPCRSRFTSRQNPVCRDSYLDTLSKERTIIKKQFIYSIFPLLICLLMPLGATAQSLEAISGPTHGKSGDILTFVVEARDSDGNPQPEVEVLFGISPSDDTSELGNYSATTNIDGRAETTLILENNAVSIYRISAWRDDDVSLTAFFTVAIDAAPLPRSITPTTTTIPLPEPPTLSIVSGDGQEGVAGTVLADPFVVELLNEDGVPLRRITVTFTVTAGRGAMSVVTSRTDSDGRVASVMTLSPEPGINRVRVSVEGLDQTVAFNAEGTAPPSEPTMPSETEEMTHPQCRSQW